MKQEALIRVRTLSAMVAAATLAAACGGGSDDAAPPPPVAGPPPAPATVAITGKAVDGALQGAIACYDLNNNNACDSGEPVSASTPADGSYTLDVATAVAGQHRVVVNVPATAIDADTGAAVGRAFVMTAPATGTAGAQSVFVSPLTTLVQQQMTATGQSRTDAAAFIQQQTGLAVSPLADFTASGSADNKVAANAARLTVMAQQQQATALAAGIGQNDLSGAPLTQADVDKAVAKAVTGALPVIGAAAADPVLVGKTGSDLTSALTTSAGAVVAAIGLTVDKLKVDVGIGRLPLDTSATSPEAGAALAGLQYTDANNWFTRVNHSTALDNTPDANGKVAFYDVRTRMVPYAFQPTVGVAESFAQNTTKERAGDLHWSGTAWVACFLGQRNLSTVRDAQGRSSYSACDNFNKGVTTRAVVDIAGLSMASVITDKILPVVGPATLAGTGSNGWSLDTALLGADTFPAGSRLFLQSDVGTETAPAYDVRAVNQVTVFSQAVADGGDGRVGTVACQTSGTAVTTVSLDEMAVRFPGKPCIFGAQTNADGTSLNPSEAWGLSSVSMGDVANYYSTLPAGTGNYYNNVGRMRVGFTGVGNGTEYFQCLVRRLDNSTRNCTKVGSGTYTIATLGDARVMTFNNLPAALQRTASQRVFVERGGKVYFGYRNPVGVTTNNVRLNFTGAKALMAKLGLPGLLPADAPNPLTGAKATNQAAMKGVWYFSDAAGTGLLRVGDNGEYVLAITDAPSATERPGYERGWLDIDAQGKLSRLIAVDTDGADGLSHHDPAATLNVTDTTFTVTQNGVTEGFDGRLPDSGSGIVGMWALGSATDLKVTQFVFFGSGKVLSIHPAETQGACATARQGPPGIEWSDYSFNATTGALRIFNKIYDTSGCTGAFDSSAGAVLNGTANTEINLVLTIAADGKTATFLDDDGVTVLTLHRITPNP